MLGEHKNNEGTQGDSSFEGEHKGEEEHKETVPLCRLDSEGQKPQKEAELTKLTVVDALIALEEAQTNAAFGKKLVELSKLTAAAWASEPIFEANYAAYKADIQALANAARDSRVKVEARVVAVNATELGNQFTVAKLAEIAVLDPTKVVVTGTCKL